MKILTPAATPTISLSLDFPSTGEQPYGPTVEAGFQKLLDSTSALKNQIDGVLAPGGVTDAMIGNRVVDPALVPTSSNPTTHTDRLSQLANRVAAILGTDWFGTPAATLAGLAALTATATRFQVSGVAARRSYTASQAVGAGGVTVSLPAGKTLHIRRRRSLSAASLSLNVQYLEYIGTSPQAGGELTALTAAPTVAWLGTEASAVVYTNATASAQRVDLRVYTQNTTAGTLEGNDIGWWMDLEIA